MTAVQQALTVVIVACLMYVAVSTWLEHRPGPRGRHRGDLAAWMLSRHRVARLTAEREQRGAW